MTKKEFESFQEALDADPLYKGRDSSSVLKFPKTPEELAANEKISGERKDNVVEINDARGG